MWKHATLAAALTFVMFGGTSSAQDAAKVDFGRDVQPLLKQHCVGCHGPAIHQGGFRLDRRADAMRGSTLSPGVIRPGSGDASSLYIRISGTQFGPQMPPAGALGADQIATIKRWIDEGAEWPDALSGLNTQFEDGSWLVKSRAIALQPLFDIGFPHGRDSWVSAAGTNWATLALATAVRAR